MPTPPPPYAAQWTEGAGAWESAAAWLENDPTNGDPESYVPGADNSVTIGDNNLSAYTVTFESVDTIWSINTGTVVTLELRSGSLGITYGGSIGGVLTENAGAALSVGAGYKLFVQSGSYAGTLTGAGGIDFVGGAEAIDTTAVKISTLELGVTTNGFGSTTTLGVSLTYKGNFLLDDLSGNNATLNLDGHELVLATTATLNGAVTGSGTLDLTGSAGLDGHFQVSGGAKFLVASGAVAMADDDVAVGDASVSSGLLVVAAGGTYDIVGSGLFGDTSGTFATITNLGAMNVSNDSSVTLNGNFNNTGTLTIGTGSSLTVSGAIESLDGTITGGGTLALGFGADAFFKTTTLDVGTVLIQGGNAGAFPTLQENLSYAGVFEFESQFGTLDLGGHALTLSGASDILAGDQIVDGTLDVTGTVTALSGAVGTTGSGDVVFLDDNGAVEQSNSVNLVGELVVSAGHSYAFTAASALDASGQTVINNGALSAAVTGVSSYVTSYLTATFKNNGVLSAGADNILDLAGVDTLAGSLTGAGEIEFGFGAQVAVNTSTLTVAALLIEGGNGGGTTTFNVSASYSGAFQFLNPFGTLNVAAGKTLTLSGMNDALYGGYIDGGGTIDVTGAAGLTATIGMNVATKIVDSGVIDQYTGVSLNGSLTIESGHSYVFESGALNGGTVANAGALSVVANTAANLSAVFTNTGTISVASGASLFLSGTDTLHGSLSGAGELAFGFGAQVAVDTGSVSVGEIYISGGNGGGTATFNVSVAYSGIFDFNSEFGTLDIASGKALVLSGLSDTLYGGDIDGGGLIEVTGAANLASAVGSTTATNITDAGSITQQGGVSLNGTLTILGGKTYTIASASNLGGSSATIVNSGSLVVNATTGTSYIGGTITNKNTVDVESGGLVFNSQVQGTGVEEIGAAAYLQLNAASLSSQTIKFAGSGAELALNDAADFQSDISGFGHAANEAIDLLGFDSNATKSFASVNGGLQVNISDGSHNASLTLFGNYNQSLFQLNAGSNGELLTYT